MLALALALSVWSADPAATAAPKPGAWKAALTSAKVPASLIEVTPRSNFAIVYGCDDSPFALHLEGVRLTVTFFEGSSAFQVLDFVPAATPQTYVLTLQKEAEKNAAPFRVQLRLLNPALGIWQIWGDENLMFTGRKTFIDQAQSKAVKTVKPSLGECSTTRGGE